MATEVGGHAIIRVSDSVYAVPLAHVRRVAPLPTATRLPGTPLHVAGAVNEGGSIIAVHDLAHRLGHRRSPPDRGWMVVTEHAGQQLGLVVDEVIDVIHLQSLILAPVMADDVVERARPFVAGRLIATADTTEPRPDAASLAREDPSLEGLRATARLIGLDKLPPVRNPTEILDEQPVLALDVVALHQDSSEDDADESDSPVPNPTAGPEAAH